MTDKLPVGPELDAAIAVALFGAKWTDSGKPGKSVPTLIFDGDIRVSTNIAAAWRVVEAMYVRGWRLWLDQEGATANANEIAWRVCFERHPYTIGNTFESEGATAPEAICRAALAALAAESKGRA